MRGHIRFLLRELGLVRTRIDLEEHVALLDLGSVLEQDAFEIAGDSRLELDARRRVDAADEVLVRRDLPFRGNADVNDLNRLAWVLGLVRQGERHGHQTNHRQKARESIHEQILQNSETACMQLRPLLD